MRRERRSLSNDDLTKGVRVGSTATTIDPLTKSTEHTSGAQDGALFRDLAAASHSRPALSTLASEGDDLQVAIANASHKPPPCNIPTVTSVSRNALPSTNQSSSGDPSGTMKTQLHGMENVSLLVDSATLSNVNAAGSDANTRDDAQAEGRQQANDNVNHTRHSTRSLRHPLNSSDAERRDPRESARLRDQLQPGSISMKGGLQSSARNRPFECTSRPTTQACGMGTTKTVTDTQVIGEDAIPSGMAEAVISASQFSKQSGSEDDDVNELGRLVVKHRDYKNTLQSAQSKIEDCRQKIDGLEQGISCEELVLADVRQRIETLQEEEKRKQQLMGEKREKLRPR